MNVNDLAKAMHDLPTPDALDAPQVLAVARSRRRTRRVVASAAPVVAVIVALGWVLGSPLRTDRAVVAATGTPATSSTTVATATASASADASATSAPASATTPPASAASSSAAVATWVLSTDGLGPILLGTSLRTLERQGWIQPPSPSCIVDVTPIALKNQGVQLGPQYASVGSTDGVLGEISLLSPTFSTVSGAKVGMAMGQIRSIYGSRLTIETKNGSGGPFEAAVVRVGSREMIFMTEWGTGFGDPNPVTSISVRTWSDFVGSTC